MPSDLHGVFFWCINLRHFQPSANDKKNNQANILFFSLFMEKLKSLALYKYCSSLKHFPVMKNSSAHHQKNIKLLVVVLGRGKKHVFILICIHHSKSDGRFIASFRVQCNQCVASITEEQISLNGCQIKYIDTKLFYSVCQLNLIAPIMWNSVIF